jgi:pimeloyl-ACP methyl ester carboxylesterase
MGLMVAGRVPGETLRDLYLRQWASFTGPGFAQDHPERLSELVDAMLARPTPRGLLRQQLRAAAAWGGARRLAGLTAPTVVVHGAVDKLSLVRNGMRLAQLIPDAGYVELANVGHGVPYEAPERLAELIEQPTNAPYATV